MSSRAGQQPAYLGAMSSCSMCHQQLPTRDLPCNHKACNPCLQTALASGASCAICGQLVDSNSYSLQRTGSTQDMFSPPAKRQKLSELIDVDEEQDDDAMESSEDATQVTLETDIQALGKDQAFVSTLIGMVEAAQSDNSSHVALQSQSSASSLFLPSAPRQSQMNPGEQLEDRPQSHGRLAANTQQSTAGANYYPPPLYSDSTQPLFGAPSGAALRRGRSASPPEPSDPNPGRAKPHKGAREMHLRYNSGPSSEDLFHDDRLASSKSSGSGDVGANRSPSEKTIRLLDFSGPAPGAGELATVTRASSLATIPAHSQGNDTIPASGSSHGSGQVFFEGQSLPSPTPTVADLGQVPNFLTGVAPPFQVSTLFEHQNTQPLGLNPPNYVDDEGRVTPPLPKANFDAPQVKRGRGGPRRDSLPSTGSLQGFIPHLVAANSPPGLGVVSSPPGLGETPPANRGRGRPRKVNSAIGSPSADSNGVVESGVAVEATNGEPQKKKRGRPLGSKNRPKSTPGSPEGAAIGSPTGLASTETPKRGPGRPVGSKNKSKGSAVSPEGVPAKRGPGRPRKAKEEVKKEEEEPTAAQSTTTTTRHGGDEMAEPEEKTFRLDDDDDDDEEEDGEEEDYEPRSKSSQRSANSDKARGTSAAAPRVKLEERAAKQRALHLNLTFCSSTSLSSVQQALIQRVAGREPQAKLTTEMDTDVTHYIVQGELQRTMKVMQAILLGCSIVDFGWIEEMDRRKQWVDEGEHLVKKVKCDGHSTALPTRGQFERKPKLFGKLKFFLVGSFSERRVITRLIQFGGAGLCYHLGGDVPAGFDGVVLVGDSLTVEEKKQLRNHYDDLDRVNTKWLFDSIIAYSVQPKDPQKYKPPS